MIILSENKKVSVASSYILLLLFKLLQHKKHFMPNLNFFNSAKRPQNYEIKFSIKI